MNHKILIIGSGAREHAIAKTLKRSNQSNEVFCIGSNMNPGIKKLCSKIIIQDCNNPENILNYAVSNSINIAIIGPENPLEAGAADILLKEGVKVVGPKKNLAQIETSKSFTRDLLKEYNIPGIPRYKIFNNMNGVSEFLDELGNNFVVKYDGLAGGKGVKVAGDHLHSKNEALTYCKELVNNNGQFIIEEKFIGEEFSLMSFCDGNIMKHMPAVQDHKRAYEEDKGPNTGGMGTYSNADHSLPFLSDKDIIEAQQINIKTAFALKDKFNEGYKGILYGGFMATANGVKLIEYNARFGDPEAMNVLSLLETDFIDICISISESSLDQIDVKFSNKATVCKYAVPTGYPESPIKGEPINGLDLLNPDCVLYASVDIINGKLIASGSRTIAVIGIADTISDAEKIAEKNISLIKGSLFHRSDIGTNNLIKKRIEHMNLLR